MTDLDFARMAWTQAWQVAALVAAVALAVRLFGRRRPHLAHVLWLVVLAKCLTPPLVTSRGGLFCWLQPVKSDIPIQKPEPTYIVLSGEPTRISSDLPLNDQLRALASALRSSPRHSAKDAQTASGADESPLAPLDELDEDAASNVEGPVSVESEKPSTQFVQVALRWGFGLWCVGTGLLLVIAIGRWVACMRTIGRAGFQQRDDLEALLADLRRRLKVRRRVRMIVTESRMGPAVVGLFRPTIILPSALVEGRSPQELEAVLAHELIHVRRGDLWTGLVQVLAQGAWWFHPLVWLANRRATRAAEACCDEETIAELGCDPAVYAGSLLDVLELKRRLIPVPVFPGLKPVDVTRERMERIMQLEQGCRARTPWWCWLVMVIAAAATLPGAAFVLSAGEELAPPPKAVPIAADIAFPVSPGAPTALPPNPLFDNPMICVTQRGNGWIARFDYERNVRLNEGDLPLRSEGRMAIGLRPAVPEHRTAQWLNVSADKIVHTNDEKPGRNPDPSDAILELTGHVEFHMGDVTTTADSGRIIVSMSKIDPIAPHGKSWITLNLAGNVKWKSDTCAATADKLHAMLGDRGPSDAPKLGLYSVQFSGRAPEREHAQFESENVSASAIEVLATYAEDGWGATLAGKELGGPLQKIALHREARLRTSLTRESPANTIVGNLITYDLRHRRIVAQSLLKAGTVSNEAVVQLDGATNEKIVQIQVGSEPNETADAVGVVEKYLVSWRDEPTVPGPLPPSPQSLTQSVPRTVRAETDANDAAKNAAAERDWTRVEYHLKRGEKDSAAVYAEFIVRDYSKSPRAEDARRLLKELGPKFAQGIAKAAPPNSDYSRRLEARLKRAISIRFENAPLRDVIANIARQAAMNIVIDPVGLTESGLLNTVPVSIECDDVAVCDALNLILKPLRLGYVIEYGVVRVTSRQGARGELIQQVYSVADLVVPIQRFHVGGEGDKVPTAIPPQANADFASLMDLITSTVSPETWDHVGGPGSIKPFNTTLSLVVRTTQDVHDEIADLLSQLRRLQSLQVVLPVTGIRVPRDFAAEGVKLDLDLMGGGIRGKLLTLAQAKALREAAAKDTRATIVELPKATLMNGQLVEMTPAGLLRGTDSPNSQLKIQSVISADRRYVRLSVGFGEKDQPLGGANTGTFEVPDTRPLLLDLDPNAAAAALDPILNKIPLQSRFFKNTPANATERVLLLITPQIVVEEEDEELLPHDRSSKWKSDVDRRK